MAKIFGPPKEWKAPEYDPDAGWEANKKAEQEAIEALRALLKKYPKADKYTGEVISFPVADNFARYMVVSGRPLHMIELPFGDGYSFTYANRLTLADIKQKIEDNKMWERLMADRSAR